MTQHGFPTGADASFQPHHAFIRSERSTKSEAIPCYLERSGRAIVCPAWQPGGLFHVDRRSPSARVEPTFVMVSPQRLRHFSHR
jgi:hypothetical protein